MAIFLKSYFRFSGIKLAPDPFSHDLRLSNNFELSSPPSADLARTIRYCFNEQTEQISFVYLVRNQCSLLWRNKLRHLRFTVIWRPTPDALTRDEQAKMAWLRKFPLGNLFFETVRNQCSQLWRNTLRHLRFTVIQRPTPDDLTRDEQAKVAW